MGSVSKCVTCHREWRQRTIDHSGIRPAELVARRRARACALRNFQMIPMLHYFLPSMRVFTKIIFYWFGANARAHCVFHIARLLIVFSYVEFLIMFYSRQQFQYLSGLAWLDVSVMAKPLEKYGPDLDRKLRYVAWKLLPSQPRDPRFYRGDGRPLALFWISAALRSNLKVSRIY